MGGLVAGTGICDYVTEASSLKMVAMTVNNDCNLQCDHCYLQYSSSQTRIPDTVVEKTLRQSFNHLVLVGREPFLNRNVVDHSTSIAMKANGLGKRVSAITNGTNLNLLTKEQLGTFDFIDVSFDGGPETYHQARSATYERVSRNVQKASELGADVRGINVLYKENIAHIDDMMLLLRELPIRKLMFSPYMASENDGNTNVSEISISDMLNSLKLSNSFMDDPRAFFLLDAYHLACEGLSDAQVKIMVDKAGMSRKVHFVPHTPLKIGSIRVTFDGLLLSPEAAIHPSNYKKVGREAAEWDLESAFRAFVSEEKTAEILLPGLMAA